MKNITYTLLVIFILVQNSYSQLASSFFQLDHSNVDEILSSADTLQLGFPFNQQGRVQNDPSTFKIARSIHEMHQKGLLEEGKRNDVLYETIEKNIKTLNAYYKSTSIINYEALQNKAKDTDFRLDQLFASIIICNKSKFMYDITPFLKLSTVFFGKSIDAQEMPGIIVSVKDDLNTQKLPHEKQITYWPAANAILSNPNISLPKLIEVVKNNHADEILRLRAAAFLNEMDTKSLATLLHGIDDPVMKEKMNCIIIKNYNWKNVHSNLCETNPELLDWWEKRKNRK